MENNKQEHRKKLLLNWAKSYLSIFFNFEDYLVDRSFEEHKKSIQMSGDIGQALSKIGELERKVCALKGIFLAMREDEYSDAQKFESEQAIDNFIESTKKSYPQYFKDCEL